MLIRMPFVICIIGLSSVWSEPAPPPGSKKLEVELPPEMAEQWAKGRRRALIIGISDYEHLVSRDDDPDGKEKAYDLKYADRDALAVSKLLQKELNYDSVTCLTESKASEDAIFRERGKLQKAIKEMQRAVELEKQTYEFSAANSLIRLAELHLEDGNQEGAKAAVIDSLRCLKAFTEQPRKTSGCGCEDYQYVTSRGTTCVPWDTLVYAVKQSISLVEDGGRGYG